MPDYYAILGLDRDASAESVKLAYRRLARLHHPDLNSDCPSGEKHSIDERMVQLNEAYSILSNSKSRRDYDEGLRLESVLTTKSVSKSVSYQGSSTGQSKTAPSRAGHSGTLRPRYEMDSTVGVQFSNHLREIATSKKSGFPWNPTAFEGFDWGLESVSWTSHYCVALRGFAVVDASTAKKFINYAQMLIGSSRRQIKRNYFLFLLPFRQMSEWESVSSQFQPLVTGKGSSAESIPPAGVILFDMHHGRILRLGSAFSDKRFEKFVQSIKTAA